MTINHERVLVVDVDGTLCPIKTPEQSYADLPVNTDVVETLLRYREAGFRIIISTSRNMRTYDGNLGEINKNTLPVMLKWLNTHNIPFDEIHMGKPWPGKQGFYIDDRTVRPDEFINHTHEELEAMIAEGQRRAQLKQTTIGE